MPRFFLSLVATPSRGLSDVDIDAVRRALGRDCGEIHWLNPGVAAEIPFTAETLPALPTAPEAPDGLDLCIQPADDHRRKRVLIADMDSTMIQIETLDVLAAELGIGEQVAAITARSMAGELDFVESLQARVALLKGYPADVALASVMQQVVHSPGARIAVRTMVEHGAYCALVSGGFTFTTGVVHQDIGFHTHRANELLTDESGSFTGALGPEIVGRATKRELMQEFCDARQLSVESACAVGDGANDLDMLSAAGLGVAYYGKPIVREKIFTRIDHTDLTSLLYFQGYHRDEFVDD